jgi:hypothetical protein
MASTSIRQEHIKLNLPSIPTGNVEKIEQMGLTNELLLNATHVNWAGGEPFMSPVHWEVMNKLKRLGNTDCVRWYNSNLTFPGKTISRAIDLLKHFPNVEIGASLDGVGEDVEYIREGLNYTEFCKNLRLLKKNNIKLVIDYTATSIGLLTLDKVLELCLDVGVRFTGKTVNISNSPLMVNVLTLETLTDCIYRALQVAKGTHLEQPVKSLTNILIDRYNPVMFDSERIKVLEGRRGKSGYFESRMTGKVNLA